MKHRVHEEIYFNREDICKALRCTFGFVPYRKNNKDEIN